MHGGVGVADHDQLGRAVAVEISGEELAGVARCAQREGASRASRTLDPHGPQLDAGRRRLAQLRARHPRRSRRVNHMTKTHHPATTLTLTGSVGERGWAPKHRQQDLRPREAAEHGRTRRTAGDKRRRRLVTRDGSPYAGGSRWAPGSAVAWDRAWVAERATSGQTCVLSAGGSCGMRCSPGRRPNRRPPRPSPRGRRAPQPR